MRVERSDKQLLRMLRLGQGEALCEVYARFKDPMLALALTLVQDKSNAEDIVHDVFVGFARVARELRLRSSLRAYFFTAVANRARSLQRRKPVVVTEEVSWIHEQGPPQRVSQAEQLQRLDQAMSQLPVEQREVLALRLQGGLRFREIAQAQKVSTNTALTRYRYGVSKLRSLLDEKVRP